MVGATGHKKWVWSFGEGCENPPRDRNLLGGKGKGEVDMVHMGLPVPPGFIVTTEACVAFRQNQLQSPSGMREQMLAALGVLEKQVGRKFGDVQDPLLISVRSGARISMPGMMETILDVGLNDEVVEGLGSRLGSRKVAYDSYRRFIQMYSNVVRNMDSKKFEDVLREAREREGVEFDISLSCEALEKVCKQFKHMYETEVGSKFPSDPITQLVSAVEAVFCSWDCDKAISYRRFHSIPDDWGTAVVVMLMVFGNRGEDSATGVGFTRDPATGAATFYGEYLLNAQGEDVVSGIRTPHPVNRFQKELQGTNLPSLEEMMPEVYKQLIECGQTLEKYFHDMQDVEFTVDGGKLYMLQTRAGKRTGFAAIKIACDMMREGLVDEQTALKHVEPEHLAQLLTPVFDIRDKAQCAGRMVARGLNAGPGAASGCVAFTSARAVAYKKQGVRCVLVREETSPEDFAGMVAADGILTLRGGATSHAAVVARGMGKSCVCGCTSLNFVDNSVRVRDVVIHEGDPISIDGTTGQVFTCKLPTRSSEIVQVLVEKVKSPDCSPVYQDFKLLMDLADKYRRLKVFANVDTPHDAEIARSFGAEGVGLCRTEHMFMSKERLRDVRVMLFSEKYRQQAVGRLKPYQKGDFVGIFRAMNGMDTTIRLLDPPLHEFVPHTRGEVEELAAAMGVSSTEVEEIVGHVKESNPMLGHRGCRLGISNPYLTDMQVEAITEAALEVAKEGVDVRPHIMIPVVMCLGEVRHQRAAIQAAVDRVLKRQEGGGKKMEVKIGCMIELPRACLRAEELAKQTDFFSFGTNDLTQCTLGISRDDAGHFLPLYIEGVPFAGQIGKQQILETDPFMTLDPRGIGELMEIAIERGLRGNPDIMLGLCGEHGGEPRSVKLCHRLGLHYVSCSPYRISVARLAASQAVIEETNR